MTNKQKFCVFQDESFHWYLVPWERRDEAIKIVDDIERYWDIGDYEKDCPQMPDWIQRIDGLSGLSFENPVEE